MAQVEAKAMSRWADRLRRALAEAEAPSLEAAAASTDPGIYLRGLLGGSRASTVRFRLRVWEAYARWMRTRRGRRWHQSPGDVVEYVHSQVSVPAAPSFPRAFWGALLWFEARTGFGEELKFGRSDEVRRTMEWAVKELTDPNVAKKKAPRVLVAQVLAM